MRQVAWLVFEPLAVSGVWGVLLPVAGAAVAVVLLVAGQEVIGLVLVVLLFGESQLARLPLPYLGQRATQGQLRPQRLLHALPLPDALLQERAAADYFEHHLLALHLPVLVFPLPILSLLHDALHPFQLAVVLLDPLLVILREPCLDARFVADFFKRHIPPDVHDLLAEVLGEGPLHLVEQLGELRLRLAGRKGQLLERLRLLLELLEEADFLDKEAALGGVWVAMGVGAVVSAAAGADILLGLALRDRPHIQYQSGRQAMPVGATIKIKQSAAALPCGSCGSALAARTLASPV